MQLIRWFGKAPLLAGVVETLALIGELADAETLEFVAGAFVKDVKLEAEAVSMAT